MATVLRPEISSKNKYYISKHRYYELKHFCSQYQEQKKAYSDLSNTDLPLSMIEMDLHTDLHPDLPHDPTLQRNAMKEYYSERIKMIERLAIEADAYLHNYIIKGVTEGRSYTYLRTVMGIPCGKDMYYDRYRKFFWLLSNFRK